MDNPHSYDGPNIFEHSLVERYIVLGSDFCRGIDCKDHSKEFEKLGIQIEINLTAEKKEIPPDNIQSYIWLPVVDKKSPTIDQLMIASCLINQAINNKTKIYIHCKNGHGRSPTALTAYYIRYKGKSVKEAIDFVTSKRPEIHLEEEQIKGLYLFEERLKKYKKK